MKEIANYRDPKHSGNERVGTCITVVRHGLIGEDAVVFKQPMQYSVKTNERTVLLRQRADLAKKWPEDIQNTLKMHSLDKSAAPVFLPLPRGVRNTSTI